MGSAGELDVWCAMNSPPDKIVVVGPGEIARLEAFRERISFANAERELYIGRFAKEPLIVLDSLSNLVPKKADKMWDDGGGRISKEKRERAKELKRWKKIRRKQGR